MKKFMFLLVALILFAFAIPATAGSQCTDVSMQAEVQTSADRVDLATTYKMNKATSLAMLGVLNREITFNTELTAVYSGVEGGAAFLRNGIPRVPRLI
ncbi:MAG: hypothetical protein DRH26_00525 [Deltaproteobacteria bacterium]|nr:MAG: hypothetical protein DRH26_00525 [Deltaproteobacteria bacterium]